MIKNYNLLPFRCREYFRLMRLDKPIGMLLLLWPTLIGLWFAGNGNPDVYIVIVFVLGVIVMRAAGCVINDWADRDFDGKVNRTKNRPLALKTILPIEALIIFSILIAVAIVLALQLNIYTWGLAGIGLILATIYPFMKRYTHFPQVVLGLAFAWPVPMAYAALEKPLSLSCLLLYLAMASWIVSYDTEYAMVDKADDLKIGVKSTAIIFANKDKLFIMIGHLICIGLLFSLGKIYNYSLLYYLSLIAAGLLSLYQQYLIKGREPANCFKAFLANNYFGFVLFIGCLSQKII